MELQESGAKEGPVFLRVARKDLERFWPPTVGLLAPAIERSAGQFSEGGVHAAIAAGKMQLWLTGDSQKPQASAVTAILDYPQTRVLSVPLLGGARMRAWLDALADALTAYGRANRCSAIEGYVRPGFIGAVYHEDRAIIKNVDKIWTLVRRAI